VEEDSDDFAIWSLIRQEIEKNSKLELHHKETCLPEAAERCVANLRDKIRGKRVG